MGAPFTHKTFVLLAAAVLAVSLAVVAAAVVMRPGESQPPAPEAAPAPAPATSTATSGTPGPSGEPTPTQMPLDQARSAELAPKPAPAPATPDPRFSVDAAMQHTRDIAAVGVREGGTPGEERGAAVIVDKLEKLGLEPRVETFPLPNGRTSRNVIVTIPGSSAQSVILGAHMDSKAPSPGANDNATGCGALIEIARCLSERPAVPTVELVFFGTEEMIDANGDHHHYGSRYHAQRVKARGLDGVAGMISVDMIGYGPQFVVRTMGEGPDGMSDRLLAYGRRQGMPVEYLRDPGRYGWSDHEPFERLGIPSAWVEWRDDPVYHTTGDTADHLVPEKVGMAGRLALGTVWALDETDLEALAR